MIQDDKKRKRKATTHGDDRRTTDEDSGSWHDFFNQDSSSDPTVDKRVHDPDVPWDLWGKVKCENPYL